MKILPWEKLNSNYPIKFLNSISEINCYNKYTKGSNFLGNISITIIGDVCLNWNMVNSPAVNYHEGHNYCRNPMPSEVDRPFCFTRASDFKFGVCDIPICGKVLLY